MYLSRVFLTQFKDIEPEIQFKDPGAGVSIPYSLMEIRPHVTLVSPNWDIKASNMQCVPTVGL